MKASIIIINYNDKQRISRAIMSALNQTHQDLEVIMVDDGSDEETRRIYSGFTDPRFSLIQLEREDKLARTPSRARNAGIKQATGEYICFLDSDNYYNPRFIEDMIKHHADVMFCDWQIIGLEDKTIIIQNIFKSEISLFENYLKYNRIEHQALLIKKEVLDKAGLYDERLPRSQDCDMIARLLLATRGWLYVPKVLFYFEKHEEEQTKGIASVYGKALWSMKLDIPILWLLPLIQNNLMVLLAIDQAIKDFSTKKEWTTDFKNSKMRSAMEMTEGIIAGQVREVK